MPEAKLDWEGIDEEIPDVPCLNGDAKTCAPCAPLRRLSEHVVALTEVIKGHRDAARSVQKVIMGLEQKFDRLESRFDRLDQKLDGMAAVAERNAVRAAQENLPDMLERAEASIRLQAFDSRRRRRQAAWQWLRERALGHVVDKLVSAVVVVMLAWLALHFLGHGPAKQTIELLMQ